jgi:hypothetical protein
LLRRSHRNVRSIDSAARASGQGYSRHSSKTMAMSLPSCAWISIDLSGDSSIGLPPFSNSKVTPSSRTCFFGSEKTWKPPLSVRIGPFQPMKRWSPPSFAILSAPGASARW